MKNKFIGKNKVFNREELKAIRGGAEEYYQGPDCGSAGRKCSSSADCLDLPCTTCTPFWTGLVNQEGWPTYTHNCY